MKRCAIARENINKCVNCADWDDCDERDIAVSMIMEKNNESVKPIVKTITKKIIKKGKGKK